MRDPRTGLVHQSFDTPTGAELDAVCTDLRARQTRWEQVGVDARVEALLAWRDAIAGARRALIDALVADTGRLIESAMEVDAILGSIQRWATLGPDLLAEAEPRAASIPTVRVAQAVRPYELVGVISPWNFPLLLSLIDAIPALVAGCAVIVKPSEITPRFTTAFPDVRETVFASILACSADIPLVYVLGDGYVGEMIVDRVDCVCFTGSVETGRTVAAQAARRFIPAFLELGGKDPAIVLASADIERASSAILWGSTANAGQSCQSIERVYVARDIHDEFVTALVAKAAKVTLAVPTPADGMLGPIIAENQIGVISAHLADAIIKGAHVETGGELEEIGGGTYLRPTVLTGVDHSMLVMTEETFGPIIPVMAFDAVDEAVELANDTRYGLSAAVFAGSEAEALAVARRVRAGGVSINDAALTALVHDGEKNSFNLSGLGGSRMGPAALRRFGRRQAFLIADARAPDPWWYPHLRE